MYGVVEEGRDGMAEEERRAAVATVWRRRRFEWRSGWGHQTGVEEEEEESNGWRKSEVRIDLYNEWT